MADKQDSLTNHRLLIRRPIVSAFTPTFILYNCFLSDTDSQPFFV